MERMGERVSESAVDLCHGRRKKNQKSIYRVLGHGDRLTVDFTGWPNNSKVVEQSNDWESVAVGEVDAGEM